MHIKQFFKEKRTIFAVITTSIFLVFSVIGILLAKPTTYAARGILQINTDLNYYTFISYRDCFTNDSFLSTVTEELINEGIIHKDGRRIAKTELKKMIRTHNFDSLYQVELVVDSTDETIVIPVCTVLLEQSKPYYSSLPNVDYKNNLKDITYPEESFVIKSNRTKYIILVPFLLLNVFIISFLSYHYFEIKKPLNGIITRLIKKRKNN